MGQVNSRADEAYRELPAERFGAARGNASVAIVTPKPQENPKKRQIQRKPEAENAPPPSPLIVGIGASAGGLAAFKSFFSTMPADTGMTFVLVQHLAPDHQSMLVELLAPHTGMPVAEAQDGMEMAKDHVYVIPPNATLTFADGHLRVSKPAPERAFRRPIDTLFVSLAENHGECAVGIVLSGVGSDGSLGLGTIKERGGLTVAQAEFDSNPMSGMPHSAVATGLVDLVVQVEAMPTKLIEYQRHLNEVADQKDADGTRQDASEHLQRIASIMRRQTSHDFSGYKEKTLTRRVQRRMQVLQIETFSDYVEFIRQEPQECEALFRELLIGVTQFFRDPDAFEALKANIIVPLLATKQGADPLRIWVAGCATGEEVYSIAILLKEVMGERRENSGAIIFGTDLDADAVAFARAGRYGKLDGLSSERVDRWFTKEGDDYCPVPAIRDMCVFSVHSLVKDPPFSKLDLISCRNVLIYLDTDLQNRVMQMFQYALLSGGYLFLGPSENPSRNNTKLFEVLDKKHRILQRREGRPPPLPAFDAAAGNSRTAAMAPSGLTSNEDLIARSAIRAMEKYAPAYFVIDGNHDILRFSGGEAGLYLEPSAGAANLNLFGILRKDLRAEVRAAVQEALATRTAVINDELVIRIDGQSRNVLLIVEPIVASGLDSKLCVVALRERDRPADKPGKPAQTPKADGAALQRELRAARAQLQMARDEMETYIEENKSATEEYQSVNEELQSSNEELETAKEEMQSVNEELQTVNSELNSKNDALFQVNSDLQNLLDSTKIATVFLDDELRIRNFTPATTDLFPLRQSDRGRTITDFVSNLKYSELREDVLEVQRKLSTVEREVSLKDGATTYIMRIRPYRTVKNVIDGVVITFSDITDQKFREDETAEALIYTNAIVHTVREPLLVLNGDLRVVSANRGFYSTFLVLPLETEKRLLSEIADGAFDIPKLRQAIEKILPGNRALENLEVEIALGNGAPRTMQLNANILAREGDRADLILLAFEDVTARKRDGQHGRMLRSIVESSRDAIIGKDLDGIITTWNAGAELLFGYAAEEAVGSPITMIIPPDRQGEETEILRRVRRGDLIDHFDTVRLRKDGGLIDISLTISPILDAEGAIIGASKIACDITERKRQTDHIDFLMREMSHRFNNLLSIVQAMANQTARSSKDILDFTARLNDRIQGIAYSNQLLVQQDWRGAALDELVRGQLKLFIEADSNGLEIDGPPVTLNAAAVESIGLALHELATNASKHGALSKHGGKVRVSWELFNGKTEPCFRLVWQESGGPQVKAPSRKGFGSIVLEQMTRKTLEGESEAEFAPDGLRWTLTCPASKVLETGAAGRGELAARPGDDAIG